MADETYDVFVSYSRADGRHAADIDSVLRDKGLKTFFDRRNLAAGLPWVRALEQAIGAARAVIVLIGPRGLGNTQQYERELAFVRQTRDPAFPIVPVILPDTKTDPPFDFLRVLTWIDFSHVARVSDAPDVLVQLLAAIHGREPAPEAAREAICPYRGLDAFREEDSAFFFGRGSAADPKSPIGELICQVREHPFVMVVGRSGSGKSSLVYAGLLPALRRERERFWNVLSLRPGPAPLRALAAAFNPRADNEGAAEYAQKITNEADRLRTGDPELLSHMIREELDRAEGKPDRLLLYIDQWEELYAQAPSSNDRAPATEHAADVNRFIDLLLAASRSAPVAVVGTVRADFYDPLIGHQEIKSLLPTRQVLLGKMLRSELEQTIVEPAKKVGLVFDPPSLVQRILDEAGEDEGMLPLLQYALKETWARRRGNAMTADSYARSGGVREAIRITAERTFEALSAEDQQAARQLFLRLVTPGEGQEDTRARAAMPPEPAQRKIVEQFAAPRARLLVTGFDRAARPTVEVAHEALIRTWPRLREWIGSNRDKLRARAAVLQGKAEWEQQGRRDDLLLPMGFQLERARALLADPGDIAVNDIREFIELSFAREQRERKEQDEALKREQTRLAEIAAAQDRTARSQRRARWSLSALTALVVAISAGFAWSNRDYIAARAVTFIESVTRPKLALGTLSPGRSFGECAHCPEMVILPVGESDMGSVKGEEGHDVSEEPRHKVRIKQSIAVSRFEVTFDQFDFCAILGGCTRKPPDLGWGRETRPAINVTWDDAQQCVAWLSRRTGALYELLSEAEWEYAARAGIAKDSWGNEEELGEANCNGCRSEWGGKRTAAVGSFTPNAFGLYDMHGNVWEWVEDCWHDNYDGAPSDGSAWTSQSCRIRVIRGGSWLNEPMTLRSAQRTPNNRDDLNNHIGFRVKRTLD